MKKISIIAAFFIAFMILACSKDMAEPENTNCTGLVTYEKDIKDLITSHCAYAGCHDGTGAAPGNYNFYSGLRVTFQNNDEFVDRVLSLKDMPPDDAPGPTSLDADELAQISCWVESGFPED